MKIYLIWWPPKCGKTTLSKLLAEKKNISCISVDTLQNIVFYETNKSEVSKKLPHRELRWKFKNNDDFFENNSSKEIIEKYIIQAETSKKAIRSIVETYLIDNESIIIEGYQITPKLIFELKKEFWKENISEIFLIKEDIWLFLEWINKTKLSNDWIIKNTKNENTFLLIAKMISEYWKYFKEQSEKYKTKLINMDKNFESKIDYLIKTL